MTDRARAFLEQYHSETERPGLEARWSEVSAEIASTEQWVPTYDELVFGARVAWRNSVRCIGRLPWASLQVLDCRHVRGHDATFEALRAHLAHATNGGRIRSVISIFPPRDPKTGAEVRILNGKLVRYAGYETPDGVVGDPDEVGFTRTCQALGWRGAGTDFDLLPVVVSTTEERGAPADLRWFNWPEGEALEVPIEHPTFSWFSELGLRWYAVPVVSNMTLEIGGLAFTAAPFNGYFMGTEIGARNLGDEGRYNRLPEVAKRMGLDFSDRAGLWKDRALIELNTAVLHSFRKAGVAIVDHHTAAEQFLRFAHRETGAGRPVFAEWSWIVPPISGSATGVFHRTWEHEVRCPNFFEPGTVPQCPMHVGNGDRARLGAVEHSMARE